MILNKSSVERGLSHAYVYKTEMVDLREEKGKKSVLEPEPHDARSRVRGGRVCVEGVFEPLGDGSGGNGVSVCVMCDVTDVCV